MNTIRERLTSARVRTALGMLLGLALVAGAIPGGNAELLNGLPESVAAAPGFTPPSQGTPEEIDGRQFGDPADGIDLVEEPVTDSFGSAQVAHPIDIPTGRISWQPGLSLQYSSDGGNGWMGLGWDLALDAIKVPAFEAPVSADAIEVDTRWGVPRFDPSKESETYVFGGEQLFPAAHHRSSLLDRESERIFTKRVEGDYLRILRHGDEPSNYWWEVHDKIGNKYFYGGVLDEPAHEDDEGTLVPARGHQVDDAVLKADGNAYWWGLTEKWDISTNVVTYYYDKQVGDTGVDGGEQAGAPGGTEIYLERINYTGYRLRPSALPTGGEPLPRFGPYDIRFVRDEELGEQRRSDVTMDATNGAMEVDADLLRRIDVYYTAQPQDPAVEDGIGGVLPPDVPRQQTELVRRYVLNYETGAFGKTLLRSVDKTDENGNVVSTNTFDYYDDVPRDDDDYNIFGPTEVWNTGDGDDLFKEYLGVESGSALGGAESLGGDGRLFLGVGIGGKIISAGGGVQFAGSDGETDLEFIDINGDSLPDKVFNKLNCDAQGARICYRLNTSGAGSSPGLVTFGPVKPVLGELRHLSESTEFSVGAGAEAYGGPFGVMYNHTWTFMKQTSYFADVNADGLPDLVRDGDVLFNHLRSDGDIEFTKNSGDTDFVIDQTGQLDPALVPDLGDAAEEQAGQFPRQDTVRRWLAPFSGTISVDAPVSLAEPEKSADGVRVAIQRNGTELWHADVEGGDTSVHVPEGVDSVDVSAGDRIYFRLQSKNNGVGDIVNWSPTITYAGGDLGARDVNGKQWFRYAAPEDFTLAGYPGTFVGVPFDGRVRIAGDVVKSKTTSDHAQVRVYRNDVLVYCDQIDADETGTFALVSGPLQDCSGDVAGPANEVEFDVLGSDEGDPQDPDDDRRADTIRAEIQTDTNIDPNAFSWAPELSYVSVAETDAQGEAIPVVDENGDPLIELKIPSSVDIYPNTNGTLPQASVSPGNDGQNIAVNIAATDALEDARDEFGQPVLPTRIIFSVKRTNGDLIAKHPIVIPEVGQDPPDMFLCGDDDAFWGPSPQGDDAYTCTDFVDPGLRDDDDYYFDFTFEDASVAPLVTASASVGGDRSAYSWWGGHRVVGNDVDVFPPIYRGWGYVGYNGDGLRALAPINEDDLVIKQENLPDADDEPEGFDDEDFQNPVNGNYYPYVPSPGKGYWRGPKDVDTEGLTPEEIESLGELLYQNTWGGPAQASASLMGGDEIGAPPPHEIIAPGATAPVIYGESNADAFGGGAGPLGGGAAWAESKGLVDYIDLNGDAFPDVAGVGCPLCTEGSGVLYTNQVGVPSHHVDHGWDEIREDHEFADQAGGGGTPAAPKSSASGDAQTQKDAGKKSTPFARKGKGGGSAKAGGHRSTGTKGKATTSKGSSAKSSSGKGTAKSSGKGSTKGSKGKGATKIGAHRAGGRSAAAKAGKALQRAIPYMPSIGIEGTLAKQETNGDVQTFPGSVETDLADLNGDGLPDRVIVDKDGTMHVDWNLGYRFVGGARWPTGGSLEQGSSSSQSLGISVGFNAGIFDFSGGAQLAVENESTDVTWADVNGDGLDDRLIVHLDDFVTRDSDGVTVQLNTGTGLTGEMPIGDFMEGHVARSESTSLGGGADFTIAIPLPYCLFTCQFLINPGFHVNKGHSAPRVDLVDVDGDGYLDTVSSEKDSRLSVRRSMIGRTNLLRSVERPLGATFTLEYEREGNTPAYPESTWVLGKVTVHDGHAGDGADTQVTTYRYEDPRFSYAEREDYGFGTVIEEDRDPSTGGVYRSWEYSYENTNYYTRGLLKKEVMRDGEQRPLLTTVNTYDVRDAMSGDLFDVRSASGSAFPRLVSEETSWHDAGGAAVRSHRVNTAYDLRGNPVLVTDLGESATDADDAIAEVAYDNDEDDGLYCDPHPEYPWTQFADGVVVKAADGTVLQRREGDVSCDAASVSQVRDHLDPTVDAETPQDDDACDRPIDAPDSGAGFHEKIAVTEVCYLPIGGQVSRLIGPANASGQRYVLDFGYDDPDRLGSFVTRTEDSFGLVTRDTYDNRFGRLVQTIDPVGAETTYEYDARNRLVAVVGPLEQGTGRKTVAYEYGAEADDPWVVARHVDATAGPGSTIDTVTIVDGLLREIQTKHDAALFTGASTDPVDRRVISGRTFYDAFGRVVREHYPIDEPTSTSIQAFRPEASPQSSTTSYDALDRMTRLDEPGTRRTEWTYGFTTGPFTGPVQVVLETGPGDARTRTYTDVRDNVVGVERLHAGTIGDAHLLTRYLYDPLQRLHEIIDPHGKTTTADYDLVGRRTSVTGPNTGTVRFEYDLASNLIAKITPNLDAAGERIEYRYDQNRLAGVEYPQRPGNDVSITYGAPGADEHAAGLITRVEDGSRIETRGYDRVGNVVRETSVMKVDGLSASNAAQFTYSTRYSYDAWGRLLKMTFPDGEVLTYDFDSGGEVRAATGRKGAETYPYLKRLEYDRFGNERLLEYNNGLVTQKSYDPNTLWLTDLLATKGSKKLAALRYAYDAVGNVLERRDDRDAPSPKEKGGPSRQTFAYDDLYRLIRATGTYNYDYDAFTRKTRTYDLSLTYDEQGRVSRKTQSDRVGSVVQIANTYDHGYAYASGRDAPTAIGPNAHSYDANGNLVEQRAGNKVRSIRWTEDDRPEAVSDGNVTTSYVYDADGELSVRRDYGLQAESAFVNDAFTVAKGFGNRTSPTFGSGGLDGYSAWKSVLVNDREIAVKRVANGLETALYYLSPDLVGTNGVITDRTGVIAEHTLFTPSGEVWARDSSTPAREENLFAGAFFDQSRNISSMGARWYEPRSGIFYSADPVLVGNLDETVEDARLLDAYTYAYDNPQTYVDESGLQPTLAVGGHRAQTWVSKSRPSAWLRASPDYNSPNAFGARDSFARRLVSFVLTEPKGNKLTDVLDEFDPPLFEPTVLTDDDGYITGISEGKIETFKKAMKFMKKHRFRRFGK